MLKELEFWQFVASRLIQNEPVMLLIVGESAGSSPGRAGYKLAVAADGELCGSIGGGVMEVRLVEQAKQILSEPSADGLLSALIEQEHRKNSKHPSGMICSGRQTVIMKQLTSVDSDTVNLIIETLQQKPAALEISNSRFQIIETSSDKTRFDLSRTRETDFIYQEKLGTLNDLYIIGGGHCALALSEVMSKLDFHIHIFDDRPELNTLKKNEFADTIMIVDSYEKIGDYIESGEDTYVVVMTLGYASDAVAIRQLVDRDFKYFGVLGSKAKMVTLMKELRGEHIDEQRLSRIRTPIGLPINSRTPEEIAISIAGEIIAVRNKAIGHI